MKRKSLVDAECPIAKALDHVGDWWSLLIVRDVHAGLTRFDALQKSLDIAPNMLTRRLNKLLTHDVLEKRQYSQRPPRYEYLLTDKGRALQPVLLTLLAWGNRFLSEGELSIQLADRTTGELVEPVLVDAKTGKVINGASHQVIAGPAASAAMKERIAMIQATSAEFNQLPKESS